MRADFIPCDLCGLPVGKSKQKSIFMETTYRFCCLGCRQVFNILWEASDSEDPARFRETELFKKCRDMGIIPGSEDDQAKIETGKSASESNSSTSFAGVESVGQALPLNLQITGMWCLACSWVLEEILKKMPGITDVSCNFSTDRLRCEYDPMKSSPDQIIAAINRIGYQASIPGETFESNLKKKEFIRFAFSAFLTANVMMLSFALYSGFFIQLTPEAVYKLSWPIFVLTGVVLLYGGAPIYQRAWTGFSTAAFGMETLITIGACSAYLYSTFNLLSGSIHLFFDTAAVLITLTLLGKTIERKALDSIHEDLKNFFSLKPTKAKRCSIEFPDGRYVSAELLRKDDVFMIEAGEIVPADGLIFTGTGSVDESSITGEARPIQKTSGNRIKSGTRVLQGAYRVRAEAVGGDSILGQMILIMETALQQKTPLEGKTDRILRFFVPIVLMIAAATGLTVLIPGFNFENALIRSLTVLVIACPCALGIAIPIARVAGISLAENRGVLIRDFSAFERVEDIDEIVLDKTGTLTKGDWELLAVHVADSFVKEQVLQLAGALERKSDHFIATEIVKHAPDTASLSGRLDKIRCYQNGISGIVEGDEVHIGSKNFISNRLKNDMYLSEIDTNYKDLNSTVYMSCSGRLCAWFVFGDTLKDGAAKTIEQLRNMGYRVSLISGDGDRTTRITGELLGINKAFGDKLPQDKALFIQKLQTSGKQVAMVGDGVNDAPALVQSDLAIAVHSGSHLGKEAADITLMRGSPEQIPDFLNLARVVNRKIHQNLIFSLIYNIISIPIAMSGLLTPLVAVCAMLLSSLSVIVNTLIMVKRERHYH
jgi:heavy metal translocating P-type ATPase